MKGSESTTVHTGKHGGTWIYHSTDRQENIEGSESTTLQTGYQGYRDICSVDLVFGFCKKKKKEEKIMASLFISKFTSGTFAESHIDHIQIQQLTMWTTV